MLRSWMMTGYRTHARRGTSLARRVTRLGVLVAAAMIPLGATLSSQAQTSPKSLRVAVSSDLGPVMPVLAQTYERQTGIKLAVTVGSSSDQVKRIERGEATDLFLGADFTFPEKLIADGVTDAKAPTPYAKGTLVLFARKDSPLQPLNLERLEDSRLQKLAVADDLHTPFGRSAAAALTRLRLAASLQPKLVVVEDVPQAAQLVESGGAQLGLISLTLAMSAHYRQIGTYVIVPASQYPEMKEYAVVLQNGDRAAAHQFMDWLLSSDIQTKLPNIGLDPIR